ncbi:flavin-dependent oxidoreductase [Nocardioides hungaricus]
MNDHPNILIVGAGVGGLVTALHLQRIGIDCSIIEAVPEFGPVGVGINILPHASQELGDLGLRAALSSESVLTRETAFYNRFGQLVYQEPSGTAAGYSNPQYSIHRAALHSVLLDAVEGRLGQDAILRGHRLLRFDQDSETVRAQIERADESHVEIRASALVGADGIHSVVRKQFYPAEGSPRYSGVTMWRGVSMWEPFLGGDTMVRVGSLATGQLVIYPIRDPSPDGKQLINWVVELEIPQRQGRGWNEPGHLEDFIDRFEDWHFDWLDVPSMLAAAETILEYPMVDQDPLARWTHGRVTLLGDAAHPMIPRGSNGAGQTILDARELATNLQSHRGDLCAALAAYEAARRPATSQLVIANRTESPDAILRLVHDRTGGRPFERIEDVADASEFEEISANYRKISGASRFD